MRSTIVSFILMMGILLSPSLSYTQGNTHLELKDWTFRKMQDDQKKIAHIPGNIFLDLKLNGLIPDPLLGSNESKLQWVSQQEWIYETLIDISPKDFKKWKNKNVRVHFPCIDTYADLYINDEWAGRTDNAFIHWNFPIQNFIKQGKNVIRVVFQSPYVIAQKKLTRLPYPLPGDSIRAVTRKPQYEFGWDWGPNLAGCGIRQLPYIEVEEHSFISEHWLKIPTHPSASFEINFTNRIRSQSELFAQLKDANGNLLQKRQIISEGTQTFTFSQKDLPIWYPNGHGQAALFMVTLELWEGNQKVDEVKIRSGNRTVELIQEKDSWGQSFFFKVNGKKVFMKGANYIPIRYFHESATREDYEHLLGACKKANINMLRVWGGGIYETDLFYDLCDEYGILIWQDFMFACSMYPGDEAFLASVRTEAEQQVKRLSHHPCMALWCGNNENSEGWERWGWKTGISAQNIEYIQQAYDDVFSKILPQTTSQFCNTSYWGSSPKWGRGDKRSLEEGDCHYWGVWHDGEPFEILQTKIPRFMSEFGMQSYPSAEVIEEMCEKKPCNEKDPGKIMHQKHPRGFLLMHEYMKKWHPTGETLSGSDYGKLTQYVQAEGIIMGIEAQRRHPDRCGGTLIWQLNDVWPAYSWSAMDYRFNEKPLMQQLAFAYAPILASLEWNQSQLQLYLINELIDLSNVQCIIKIHNDDQEEIIFNQSIDMQIGAQILFESNSIQASADQMLSIELKHKGISGGTYYRKMKLLPLSHQFLVPDVINGQWSCKKLLD